MTAAFDFTHYQAEALIVCLIASIVWAGVLYAGARGLERAGSMTSAQKLWVAALLFAVLPSLIAPTLAAFGVSLRPQAEPVVMDSAETFVRASAPLLERSAVAEPASIITPEQIIGAGAIIYVYGVILAFFLWAARHAGLYYAIARADPVEDLRLLDRIDDWADRLDVRRPDIRRSRHVSSVCIFGVLRQTILVPRGIEERVSLNDLALMCAHELAHVRRGDTRLFTATALARVLFWFNPLVSRIASRAELAAEESADALVLARGVDRRAYAACFVEGLKFAASKMNAQPVLAPSFTPADRRGRRRRLNAILSPEPQRMAPLSTRLLLSAAASGVALIAVGQAAFAVNPDSASERRRALKDLPLIGEVTMGFSERIEGDLGKDRPFHEGLDIKAPNGATVFAPGDGIVVEATDRFRDNPAWGKVVVVDHGHGLVTRYAHLGAYSVKKGDRVKAGDAIAAVGATGKVSGPHLHFETLQDGEPIDPVAAIEPADAAAPAPALAPIPEPFEVGTPRTAVAAAPASPVAPAATRFSFRFAGPSPMPAFPVAPRAFPSVRSLPGIKVVKPVFAPPAADSDSEYQFAEATGLMFADGSDAAGRMAEDMEKRLLGAIGGENVGQYNMTLSNDGKVYRFSSDEPMTAEKRAEMREALREMRREREQARKEAAREREEWRREAERAKREAERAAEEHGAYASYWDKDHIEEMREQFEMSRREILEEQRQAIEEARADLDEAAEDGMADALSDLDDAASDLDDIEISAADIEDAREAFDLEAMQMSAADIEEAREAIEAARRQIERNRGDHERAIAEARAQLEAQRADIDRMLGALDDEPVIEE